VVVEKVRGKKELYAKYYLFGGQTGKTTTYFIEPMDQVEGLLEEHKEDKALRALTAMSAPQVLLASPF